jgi:hypothetical protein
MTERKLVESEQRLRQTNARLEQLTDQVHEKQQVYDEQNNRHNQLNTHAEQRQAVKERLEHNIQDVNNQWTSKRVWITSAAKHLAELNQNIGNIKIAARQTNTEHQEKRQNLSIHNRNASDIHQRRREHQQQLQRKS